MITGSKKYKVFAITSLHNLSITQDLGEGLELFWGMKITNNRRYIQELLSYNVRESIGPMEMRSLLTSNAVLFSIDDVKSAKLAIKTPRDILDNFLYKASLFSTAAWMIKDNAIKFEMAFLEIPYKSIASSITSNLHSALPTNCRGTNDEVELTVEELGAIRKNIEKNHIRFDLDDSLPNYTDEANRLERAMYFLSAARASNDVGLKIAFYCTCFEALFSTDNAELTHKLSERLAFFAKTEPVERLTLYREIREAYKFRSTVVHGDRITTKKRNAMNHSVQVCDTTFRLIINKIYETEGLRQEFLSNNENLEQFFTDIIFGIRVV